MKWFKILVILLLVVEFNYLFGQCEVQDVACQTGEKITYEVAYNWGFIWVDAGEVYFKTDTSEWNGKKVYGFEAYGTSFQYYDWLYKVRDLYQAKVEMNSFQPLWFLRKTNEGGNKVYNEYRFKPEEQNVIVSIMHNKEQLKTDTLPLDNCRFDVLSAVYFARTINFNVYQKDEKIPVKILIDDEFYETHVRYLGKEIIRNRSGKKFRCHKMSALLVEGTIFKGGEDLVVWVTDDQNKIPVMAEAKILIGSVKAYLTGYEGLKYKMDAEVEEKK